MPLPGWSNWDCSLRNCPAGHTANARHGYAAKREVQRVVCDKNQRINGTDYFILSFMGANTARIYDHYSATQIRSAIEYCPYIGNVTVSFPLFEYDNISTACHSL